MQQEPLVSWSIPPSCLLLGLVIFIFICLCFCHWNNQTASYGGLRLCMAWQVADVSDPVVHDELPLGLYPELQVGWQVDPEARVLVQSPAAPFAGGLDASHVAAWAEVTVYPWLVDNQSGMKSGI